MFLVSATYDEANNQIVIDLKGEFTQDSFEEFEKFNSLYKIDNIVFHPTKKPSLQEKSKRKCRFCEKEYPEVNFKKIAHQIPQLMGNKHLITDEECDNCNVLFSKYENDLAHFMGASRTLSYLKGQNGLPKYKSPDKNLIIEKGDSNNKNIKIKITSMAPEASHFIFNHTSNQLTINSIRHPYTPTNIFKLFLKIAYSLLPIEEIKNYRFIQKILLSNEFDDKIEGNPMFQLIITTCPGPPFPSPIIFCYKKIDIENKIKIPSRTFIVYFQNYIYQFFLPYCQEDIWLSTDERKIFLHFMPPLLTKTWIEEHGTPSRSFVDLSTSKLQKNKPQEITMNFDEIIYPQRNKAE